MKPFLPSLFVLLLAQYVPLNQPFRPQQLGGYPQPVLPGMASPQERIQNGGNPWPRGTIGNPVYSLPQPSSAMPSTGAAVPNQPMRFGP